MNIPGNEDRADFAFKLILFATLAILLVFLVYKLKIFLVLIILSTILASAISPLAEYLEAKKIPRILTVLMLYLSAFLAYAFLAGLLTPAICEQWHKLNENLPQYLIKVSNYYHSVINSTSNDTNSFIVSVEDLKQIALKFFEQTLHMTAGFVGLVLNTLLVLFLSAYFVVDAKNIWTKIFQWLPEDVSVNLSSLVLPIRIRLAGYVRGQLTVAFFVFLFLLLGFSFLGVKYALLLACLAGLFNLLPYVGSFFSCFIALFVAFNQEPLLALGVIVLFAVEQWLESTFIVPYFLGNNVSLHPLLILISIIVGGTLMGALGALISVPILSVAIFLIEKYILKK